MSPRSDVPRADRKKQLREDYRELFTSEPGKRVLHDLMRRFHILGANFNSDPYIHAFSEGERNAILHLIDQAVSQPSDFERLYEESRTQRSLEWQNE